MKRKLLHVLGLALCLPGLVACGSEEAEGTDLRTTCAAVREAFPPTRYDDDANARFARELDEILADAEPRARAVFDDLQSNLADVVSSAGDNEAVVTAGVELLAAIEEVNAACREAGAKPVLDLSS